MQPAFHRDRIASYATVMTDYADRMPDRWTDGATIDASQEMIRLTLGIVGKTLFDADVESQARMSARALTAVMDSFWMIDAAVLRPARAAADAGAAAKPAGARDTRRDHLRDDCRAARQSPRDRGDLLSMLLMAQDEEADGRGMTDLQVRDEAMTIFLAGHETTANALTWTWYLLSQAPEVEARLHEEIDRVLGGRLPTIADIPSLPYRRAGRDRVDAPLSAGVDHRPPRARGRIQSATTSIPARGRSS